MTVDTEAIRAEFEELATYGDTLREDEMPLFAARVERNSSNAIRMCDEIDALRTREELARAAVEAAKAEVRANGYRSSDMARALESLCGEFWFETDTTPEVGLLTICGYAITTEMDDGPLTQLCQRPPHGVSVEHYYGAAWKEAVGE